jgi:hypothetical protein
MKLLKICLVAGLAVGSQFARAGSQGPSAGDDCYDDVQEAKSACTDATVKAGQLNNQLAMRQLASAQAASTGAKQTGLDQSTVSSLGSQNGDWATGECERARTKMRDKCSDAAKRIADKRKGDEAAGDKAALAQDDQNLKEVKKNYKDGTETIQAGETGIANDQGSLNTAGVAGGNAVSGASGSNPN